MAINFSAVALRRARLSVATVAIITLAASHSRSDGRVMDLAGRPLANVRLTHEKVPAVEFTSDANGRFVVEKNAASAGGRIVLLPNQGLIALRSSIVGRFPGEDLMVVACKLITITGRIDGTEPFDKNLPVVRFASEPEDLYNCPFPLDSTVASAIHERADRNGAFSLAVPECDIIRIAISCPEYQTQELVVRDPTDSVLIHLTRVDPLADLAGRVTMMDGTPAGSAIVRHDMSEVVASADGEFRLPFTSCNGAPVIAYLDGYQPAISYQACSGKASSPMLLSLGPPTLSITGQLVHESGAPCVNWQVELADGLEVRPKVMPTMLAEHLVGGRQELSPVRTNEYGHFEIRGLWPRRYFIDAWPGWGSDDSLMKVQVGPVLAGEVAMTIQVPSQSYCSEVRGRVVDLRDRPVAGVELRVDLDLPLSFQGHHNSVFGPMATSGDAGEFAMSRVPRRYSKLVFESPSLIPGQVAQLECPNETEEQQFNVAGRAYVRFLWDGSEDPPNEITIVDEFGQRLNLYTFWNGRAYRVVERFALRGRSTHAIAVSEAGTHLIAIRGGREVARVPLELVRGQVCEVRAE